MNKEITAAASWRMTTLAGVCLIALPFMVAFIDEALSYRLALLNESRATYFMLVLLVGSTLTFVGCVGWANHWTRRSRALMAGLTFLFPWAAILLDLVLNFVTGETLHDDPVRIASGFMLFPSSLLTIVLLAMAIFVQ